MNCNDFEQLWAMYPNKLGKKHAERHFRASVKTEQDLANIKIAMQKFLSSPVVFGDPQYIPHGKTWFYNWQDWVTYEPPVTQKTAEQEKAELHKRLGLR